MIFLCLASQSESTDVYRRVRISQDKTKLYTDTKRHAATPTVRVGDFVRTRIPVRSHKLAPMWSEPQRVVAICGPSVVVENGRRWNIASCLLHRPLLKSAPQARLLTDTNNATSQASHKGSAAPTVSNTPDTVPPLLYEFRSTPAQPVAREPAAVAAANAADSVPFPLQAVRRSTRPSVPPQRLGFDSKRGEMWCMALV